jgi:membrane protease YdiL (CAAX protease family)
MPVPGQPDQVRRYSLGTNTAVVAGLLLTVAAVLYFWFTTHRQTAVFLICPGVTFTALLVLGSDRVLERLQRWIDPQPRRAAAFPAGLWLLYAVYAVGMGIASVPAMLSMVLYLGLPFLVLGRSRAASAAGAPWLEGMMILWLWLPMQSGTVRSFLLASTPATYGFLQLLAIDAAILAFAVWNRTPGTGYRIEWDRSDLTHGLTNFLVFIAIGIPLGLAIGFIHFNFRLSALYAAPLVLIGVFFGTALPEEFLFRGLIQNWLQRRTGASHLNNGAPFPNYRYFLLATVAGIFYGRAWRNSRGLMAPSLTHALVDTCATVFFR